MAGMNKLRKVVQVSVGEVGDVTGKMVDDQDIQIDRTEDRRSGNLEQVSEKVTDVFAEG